MNNLAGASRGSCARGRVCAGSLPNSTACQRAMRASSRRPRIPFNLRDHKIDPRLARRDAALILQGLERPGELAQSPVGLTQVVVQ